MKRQPIFYKMMRQVSFNCHYMQPTQIRKELFFKINMPPSFLLWWILPGETSGWNVAAILAKNMWTVSSASYYTALSNSFALPRSPFQCCKT